MQRILIVDDHAVLRRGLRSILGAHPGWECCGEAQSGEEAVDTASVLQPDVVVMDVSMPGIGGVKATEILRKNFPRMKIVLLTLHKSTELLRAGFAAGATGYVLKSDGEEQLIAALEAVMRDETYVTKALGPEVVSKVLQEVPPANASEASSAPLKAAIAHD